MKAFEKVVRIGTSETYGGRRYSIYCKIKYDENGRLSICGVEGPLASGNCFGACGQIDMQDGTPSWDIVKYAPGWNKSKETKFLQIWREWHLNDTRAGCEHQRARGETWKTHFLAVCPECGHKLGTQWLFESVPEEVLHWLHDLPDTDRVPAWV